MDERRITRMRLGLLVALACMGWAALPASGEEDAGWRRIERDELCITTGTIQRAPDHMTIDGPEVRATLRTGTPRAAELRFTYVGPSETTAPLASGELRRQIGLKLRAQDTCNVVYVMWHIQPDTKLVVVVKRNPTKHAHAECGAAGYITIRSQTRASIPPISVGGTHTLRATLRERAVDVYVDGTLAVRASIDQPALDFDGPVGIRTDNARFRFQYLVGGREAGELSPSLDGRHNRCRD
jgi:hypothetical protein